MQVEHTLGDLTQWHGERGQTYFYQSEMPYDATQASYGDKGYVGYRVAASVAEHDAWGSMARVAPWWGHGLPATMA